MKSLLKSRIIDNTILNGIKMNSSNRQLITVILNRPIKKQIIQQFLPLSTHIFAADGGANRIYEALDPDDRKLYKPEYIIGDLDSLNEQVKQFYQGFGTVVMKVDNQDNTDLEKCFDFIKEQYQKDEIYKKNSDVTFLILGAFGGRLDQTLSNLSNLQKITQDLENTNLFSNVQVLMADKHSLAACILPGITQYIRSDKIESQQGVGIFPLQNPCKSILTKGLKWDFNETLPLLQFGSFISSSNEFQQDQITIENSDPLIFTVTLNQNFFNTKID